ncbi:MAG: hypothetical protein P8175_12525 [Deltaproteobacteria bacterium]|jgi:uncharacterized membrane protein YphA (DoxX/SURF4 family)
MNANTDLPGVGGKITRQHAFAVLRIMFGLIWVLNTWFQANSAYINHLFLKSFNAGINGQPEWIASYTTSVISVMQFLGAPRVAVATVVVDGLLALSLLTGIWLRFFAWVGIVYNLFMWSTVGGMGGPYTQGATDPGTAIVYALGFLFVILTRSWTRLSLQPVTHTGSVSGRSYLVGRILFGLLWAFDAFWKWHPYFLHHADTYLVQSQQGQPAWIVSYIQFFIDIIHIVGPFAFGLFAAVVESVIALSLLFKRGLDFMLPIGLIYSFVLWTTAEGWGGPYGPGFTGNRGDIWGTAIIYCFIFLYLMVMYSSFGPWKTENKT